jgi:hypothetical protein
MPLVDGQNMSPDDAIADHRCPECGVSLKAINPIAHRKAHWHRMPNDDVDGQEGRRRMKLFDDYIKAGDFRTSDMPEQPKPNAAPVA